jgi:hypothetical protein
MVFGKLFFIYLINKRYIHSLYFERRCTLFEFFFDFILDHEQTQSEMKPTTFIGLHTLEEGGLRSFNEKKKKKK